MSVCQPFLNKFHVGSGIFYVWPLSHVCHFASSYTPSKTNVHKIEPSHTQGNTVFLCLEEFNFVYMRFAWFVWKSKLRVRWAKFDQILSVGRLLRCTRENCPKTGRPKTGTSHYIKFNHGGGNHFEKKAKPLLCLNPKQKVKTYITEELNILAMYVFTF